MVEIRRFEASDLEALRDLLRQPELASEFDILQAPHAVEAWSADPYRDPGLHFMAWRDGRLVGFASPYVLPGRDAGFAMTRLGVRADARRQGLGTALLERASAGISERHRAIAEFCVSAWLPSPEAETFVARHGFQHTRRFWLMERPRGAVAVPEWPAGIRLAGAEDSARHFRDLSIVYNDSFAHHYHAILATPDPARALYTRPGFRTDGYVMAYRGEECVGFCRCDLHGERGEVSVLGTSQAARAIGLGRALLRW